MKEDHLMYDKIRKPLVIVNLILSAILMMTIVVGGIVVLLSLGSLANDLKGSVPASVEVPSEPPSVAPYEEPSSAVPSTSEPSEPSSAVPSASELSEPVIDTCRRAYENGDWTTYRRLDCGRFGN